ncbi:aminotransferase class III-fold pyridoxal phosphate-dependent enzyme [Sphingobium sufflavum]|uniref:aminotransferase class III-fold pyridoxal phosphate-dependent enzyme n=1 Tax=Sphingobium sufflavum TaxID=1129547 RepID=UPI001F25DA66|nr:aminotransferase class III-fold pyridoxal phosphate-dependent enzyme [Sphingobium sufflavum]MCE7796280.1 aminotransferase class III-fold pyridoxal phosphate-dependent enzyme [Sphingobium sufflavum]
MKRASAIMPQTNRSLLDIDRDHLIHPVTSFRGHEARGATILQSGKGMWLTDIDGNTVLDAFAGLWCVNVGYGHDSIVDVAAEQMRRLPYATGYFSFGNEPAILLAEQLVRLSPEGLEHVFFTLGGSDAVDSAIRYIVHYWNALGKPTKKQCIALERGYHGSSTTGSGLTALANFHRNFDVPLKWQHHIPSPYAYRGDAADDAALIAQSVGHLRAKVTELGADNVAAFFCEPIQGSGGVIVPPKGWLKAMRDACTDLGILFVADEVITGFGRTGPMFACLEEDVSPDLMTLAKGLTAGYTPMGAVLLSDTVYQGIADGASPDLAIGHGLTYSGHPVSAAVGLEVLRLYQEGGILANGQSVGTAFAAGLAGLADHPLVGDTRGRGLLGAIELVVDKGTKDRFDPSLKLPDRLFAKGYANGVIFRAFADNIIGLAPALCCSDEEMEMIFARIRTTLDQLLDEPDIRCAVA